VMMLREPKAIWMDVGVIACGEGGPGERIG